MFRRVLVAVLRLALRVFFRRVEVSGLEHVPRRGACLFVLNHPNALVDPAFLLCHAPRRVSFLAKAPLFEMPLVGYLVRAMDAIPVYRRQDEGADVSRNRETFARAQALLRSGGTIAICPEGVSHDGTQLRPLKTGAARIALGVAAEDPDINLRIVPAGLYYTSKTAFRSAALLHFGEPLKVDAVAPEEDGDPPSEAVRALSARIERALRDVTLNAEHGHALRIISRAERVFSAEESARGGQSLVEQLELRRRFIAGYAYHSERAPERLAALEARLTRYEEELAQAGIDPEDLSAPQAGAGAILRHLLTRVSPTLLLFPLAVVGLFAHYPAYRVTGLLATRLSKQGDDMVSTIKIAAATLLFPLTWLVLGAAAWRLAGWAWAVAALAALPLCGFVAVRFFEKLDVFVGGARALAFFLTRRWFFKELLVERRRLREEIEALGEEAARAAPPPAPEPARTTLKSA